MIPYKTPNSNGKMTTTVYKELLDMINDDLISRGLTLWQDRDSAHNSKGTEAWFSKNNALYITSPGNSPIYRSGSRTHTLLRQSTLNDRVVQGRTLSRGSLRSGTKSLIKRRFRICINSTVNDYMIVRDVVVK